MMHYRIGQTVPLDYPRPCFTGAAAPAWWIMLCGRRREEMTAASAKLMKLGADEAWFPTEKQVRMIRRITVAKRTFDKPVVPGLIFVLSRQWPQWDILAERWRVTPLKVGDRPVAVTPLVLAHMAEVPQRIAAMRDALAAREAAERLANMPVAGGSAVFTVGPFAGRVVQVQSVKGDEAALLMDGLRVTAKVSGLRRAK